MTENKKVLKMYSHTLPSTKNLMVDNFQFLRYLTSDLISVTFDSIIIILYHQVKISIDFFLM